MRPNKIITATAVLAAFLTSFAISKLGGQPNEASLAQARRQAAATDVSVNVFFGTTRAMSVEELKTNALQALRTKGYTVLETNRCAINIIVAGSNAGCAALFWDPKATMTYQVLFNARGEVTFASGEVTRHGTPGPNDPIPTVPEGAIRVKPSDRK